MTKVGRRRTASVLLTGLLLVAGGCNRTVAALQVHRMAPLPRGEVRYVAVLPFETALAVDAVPSEPGQEVRAEAAATTVHRALTEAMLALPAWVVTDDIVVGEALRKLYGSIQPVGGEQAVEVGRLLGVDAVVLGIVRRFEGRIGATYAARRAALVDFTVDLVVFPAAEIAWHAEYVKRQKPLFDDLSNLFGFVRARGRWLRAREIAAMGARHVASEMHHALYGGAATPVPER